MSALKNKSALIAVSGGLDSICLLFSLAKNLNEPEQSASNKIDLLLQDFISKINLNRLEAIYLDHAQRPDTDLDFKAVQKICTKFNIKLHHQKLDLPPGCSEVQARKARYQAFNEVLQKQELDHLITAHHSDDLLETALINLERGSGARGLHSLSHHAKGVWRPFLSKFAEKVYITKTDLLAYAKLNKLTWHEDSTNKDPKYLRNRLRAKLNKKNQEQKQTALDLLAEGQFSHNALKSLLNEISEILVLSKTNSSIHFNKVLFKEQELTVQNYLMHHILSENTREVDRKSVLKAVEFVNAANKGKILQLRGCHLTITSKESFEVKRIL